MKKEKSKGETNMTTWKCTVCGYVHEGEQSPEQCPLCKQPAEKFEKVAEVKENSDGSALPKLMYLSPQAYP